MGSIFDRFYRRYDAWYDHHKYAFMSELKAVRKALPRKGRGLEIGVGTGRFAAPLKIDVGIDPSEKMLEQARKRGVDARLGFGEALPFASSSFDYVALIVTLCFVKNPSQVIRESRRVLKKNGRLIVGFIDKDSFLGRSYRRKGSVFYRNARFFSVPELERHLAAKGFTGFVRYQTLSRSPDEMRRAESPKKGFGKGGFVAITSFKC